VVTGSGWAVVSAVGAAASYAGGAVVQQRAATAPVRGPGTAAPGGRPGLLRVALRPLWVLGVALDGVGFLLEFLALRAVSLTLVQPLLVSGLVFALPLGAVLTGLRVRAQDVGGAALIVGGLTVALVAAAPGGGSTPPGVGAWSVTLVVVTLLVGVLVLVARGNQRPQVTAVSLAVAAAVVNGVLSAFGKALAIATENGVLTAVLSWTTLGLVAAAVTTLTLAAAAFRAGAPTVAIGALFAGEPFFGVTGGVVLFGDTIDHGTLVLLAVAAGVLGCLLGVSLLAASPTVIAAYISTGVISTAVRPPEHPDDEGAAGAPHAGKPG
jgi:drug/metabolite transporter (DMT)-like permease